MPDESEDRPEPIAAAAPRAFTQGVGAVFQVAGVSLFVAMMFVCCGSSLFSKNVAEREDLTRVGWGSRVDDSDPAQPIARPVYSAQRATTLSVMCGVFFGLALAGLGLGLQAQRRDAPYGAVLVCGVGTAFWAMQTLFVVQKLHSAVLGLIAFVLFAIFAALLFLAVAALREMRRDPPPVGHELLPADYKVPYSHLHEDPPEVRLARELDDRRQRLAVQQKELEMLEEKIRRKMK